MGWPYPSEQCPRQHRRDGGELCGAAEKIPLQGRTSATVAVAALRSGRKFWWFGRSFEVWVALGIVWTELFVVWRRDYIAAS